MGNVPPPTFGRCDGDGDGDGDGEGDGNDNTTTDGGWKKRDTIISLKMGWGTVVGATVTTMMTVVTAPPPTTDCGVTTMDNWSDRGGSWDHDGCRHCRRPIRGGRSSRNGGGQPPQPLDNNDARMNVGVGFGLNGDLLLSLAQEVEDRGAEPAARIQRTPQRGRTTINW